MTTRTAAKRLIIESLQEGRKNPQVAELNSREQIIEACRQRSMVRDYDEVRRLALLLECPVGQFYRSAPNWLATAVDVEAVEDEFKPRLILLAAEAVLRKGDFALTDTLLNEAGHLAKNIADEFIIFEVRKEKAILVSEDGDHATALKRFDDLIPLARFLFHKYPIAYYNLQNSRAVEMMFLGRFDEALKCVNIALASPFVSRFPEWPATKLEILEARDSIKYNVAPMEFRTPIVRSLSSAREKLVPLAAGRFSITTDQAVIRFPLQVDTIKGKAMVNMGVPGMTQAEKIHAMYELAFPRLDDSSFEIHLDAALVVLKNEDAAKEVLRQQEERQAKLRGK